MGEHHHSLLSRDAILEQLGRGIVINPFNLGQLKSCSYDVCLGPYYYRRIIPIETGVMSTFNPYDDEAVHAHFDGPLEAKLASELDGYCPEGKSFRGIEPSDRVIVWAPGELILGHTVEFIGGTRDPDTGRCFTAEMKARSSIGRIGFEVCRCAGWGDVGYVNRWTMEVNNDDPCSTFLVVGTRVAQIKFYEVDRVALEDMYGYSSCRDHYQQGVDIEAIKDAWRPEMLLPRLSKD